MLAVLIDGHALPKAVGKVSFPVRKTDFTVYPIPFGISYLSFDKPISMYRLLDILLVSTQ